MNSWVITLFMALNALMLLVAVGTYLSRSAKEHVGRRA